MSSLDLALIGNGTIGALIDASASVVWSCFPRFDGDPMFCALLRANPPADNAGEFRITLANMTRVEQEYLTNTPVLVTRLFDAEGGAIEIADFAPRFQQYGRVFCPMMLVRRVTRLAGAPRISVCLCPARDYGAARAGVTSGSNHIRYVGSNTVLRLTTDASISALLEGNRFTLEDGITMLLGPDETTPSSVAELGRHFQSETIAYWRTWVRSLAIPFEWQAAVIRAAITLKLNVFEDTGAIIAAMTTSIPEAPSTERTWDYRYCWLRDAYFVINALNRLGATRSMERYLHYIMDIVASTGDGRIKPLYGISGRPAPTEITVTSLSGYRGMGPVRLGNAAQDQIQHDVYGAVVLAAPHAFFDERLVQRGDVALFRRLETLGVRAAQNFDVPDAGIWELRGMERVHTFSSVMCWAACDRLARIAAHLGMLPEAAYWASEAGRLHAVICERSWNPSRGSFVAAMDGDTLDASLLRLHEVGFLAADDPRFAGTVKAIEAELRHGDFIYRYSEPDDFGVPTNAFLACTFWFINALAALGRRDEARALFENILASRGRHGLLAEDIDARSREQWGNFVQTYSMVGIIDSAARLSLSWDQAY
ncbi:MAG: glycoside hydrolase family 15 protein [Gemmatimonadota bacterium]